MPTLHDELLKHHREVLRLERQQRKLKRQLKQVAATRKHVKALKGRVEHPSHAVIPSKLFGDAKGYEVELPKAEKIEVSSKTASFVDAL